MALATNSSIPVALAVVERSLAIIKQELEKLGVEPATNVEFAGDDLKYCLQELSGMAQHLEVQVARQLLE